MAEKFWVNKNAEVQKKWVSKVEGYDMSKKPEKTTNYQQNKPNPKNAQPEAESTNTLTDWYK